MPAFRIFVNGTERLTVSTEGLDVLDVRVSGDRLGPDPGTLGVSGSAFPAEGGSTYLTWLDEEPLASGDQVQVHFDAAGATTQPGRTIEAMYPDWKASDAAPPESMADTLAALAREPRLFATFACGLRSSTLHAVDASTAPDDHGYGFHVLWNALHPERTHVSLHRYTLQALEQEEPLTEIARGKLHAGDWVALSVTAD